MRTPSPCLPTIVTVMRPADHARTVKRTSFATCSQKGNHSLNRWLCTRLYQEARKLYPEDAARIYGDTFNKVYPSSPLTTTTTRGCRRPSTPSSPRRGVTSSGLSLTEAVPMAVKRCWSNSRTTSPTGVVSLTRAYITPSTKVSHKPRETTSPA